MKVLSMFDGMSCGQMALDRLGIPVETYYASEIDKYAIEVCKKNYPNTIHVGDISNLDPADFMDVDLMLAGSPCQGFSFAGKQLAFDDPRSALFFEFIRLLKGIKPKYFLLENVMMQREFLDVITQQVSAIYPEHQEPGELFGGVIKPILLNSSLVSAQSRQRYYWTNIKGIREPEDRGILLKDILEDNLEFGEAPNYLNGMFGDQRRGDMVSDENEKANCLTASMYKGQISTFVKRSNKPQQVGLNVEEVKVRKHEVDIEGLQKLLRSSKESIGITNKELAEELELPLTKVEHWFRTDASFAIPTDDVWIKLKKTLDIETDAFDQQVLDFEFRDGVYESTQRVYSENGKSPTLTAASSDQLIEMHIDPTKPKQIGIAVDINGHDQLKRVYSPEGKSPTLTTMTGGHRQPKIIKGAAIRGRYTEDGIQQMLELRSDQKANSITTVPTDSIVSEKLSGAMDTHTESGLKILENLEEGEVAATHLTNSATFGNSVSDSGKAFTLRASNPNGIVQRDENLQYRKLTPLECERLQTVPDNYTDCVSNTQRYKMLGNGWTVDMICHILSYMELDD